MNERLYVCNPQLNTQCRKTSCQKYCFHTHYKEYELQTGGGKKMKQNQCEKIVDYIKQFGSITTMEAFADLGITRLASRIHDLVCEGYVIEKTVETGKNRFGDPVHFTRYSIKEG